MRLRRLDLVAFGPFTDRRIDLAQGPPGLQLIFGPNEAGKSTLLRAIHGLLFGIETKSDDDHVHVYKKMRIGAALTNLQGAAIAFVRRKGRAKTLLDPAADDAALPEDALRPFLGSMDGDTFQKVYGIDHRELEQGGRALQRLEGLAGESLATASLGIAGLSGLLDEIDQEAKGLFETRKNSASSIRKAMKQLDAVRAEARGAEVSASAWDGLRSKLRKLTGQQAELLATLKDKREQRHRLDRLRSVLGYVGERASLVTELAAQAEVLLLPADYDAEVRREAQPALASAEQRRQAAAEELDGDDGLIAQIGAIDIPEALLEQETAIAELRQELGANEKASVDVPKREAKRKSLRQQAESLLAELRSDIAWDEVGRLRLPRDVVVGIQTLAQQEQQRRAAPIELERQAQELDSEIDDAQQTRARLPDGRDAGRLRDLVARIRGQGELESRLGCARAELKSLQAEADRKHAALGLFEAGLAELTVVAMPVRKTLERFAADFSAVAVDDRALAARSAELREQQEAIIRELDLKQRDGDLPSVEGLQAGRERRDRGWSLIRAAWLDDARDPEATGLFTGEGDDDAALAGAYEQSVQQVDRLADRLRQQADLAAEVEQLRKRRRGCEADLERSARARGELDDRRDALNRDWRRQWAAIGIAEPLAPQEMLEWLERVKELTAIADGAAQRSVEVEELASSIEQHRGELARCLQQQQDPAAGDDESLQAMLERAAREVARIDEDAQVRRDLDKTAAAARKQLDKLQRRKLQADEDLAAWQQRWSEAMALLAAGPSTTAAEANARIGLLADLFDLVDEVRSLERRIEAMAVDRRQFEGKVRELAERLAPEIAELEPAQVTADLNARVKKAGRDRVQLRALKERAEAARGALKTATEQQREARAQLDELRRQAKVDDYDQLAEAEAASERKRSHQERLQEIDANLLQLGGGATVEETIARAAGRDASDLEAEIKALEEEIIDLESRREELGFAVREAEQERDAVDGSGAAAEAAESGLGILGRIQQDARQFIRLRLAAAILRRHIEQQRAETQDPILALGSELFAQLTCGSFTGVTTSYDQGDKPYLSGLRAGSGEPVPLSGLSEGTADQLYLALRIAYLERNLERGEPMPVIADDILVNFDDERARATLRVLVDLSRRTQVLLLTHHDHLRKMAREVVPAEALFEHEL